MYLNFFDIIILFGALQGLILSLVLFFSRPDDRTPGNNNFLAILLLILVYNGVETFSWSSGQENFNYFFNMFSNVFIFGLGPCLYLYIKSFTRSESITTALVTKHFSLVGLQLGFRGFILLISILNISGSYIGLWSADLDAWHKTISDKLSVVVFIVYLIFSAKEIWHYQQSLTEVPEEEISSFKWMRALIYCMAILGIAWAISTIYPVIFKASQSNFYYPIEILQVLFIYWLGITGFYRIKVVQVAAQNKSNAFFESIDQQELKNCEYALTKSMTQEELYLDPNLTVNKLANHINYSPKTVSAVLNQYMQQGFNEFVNTYRIQEVKRRLAHPAYQSITIAGIAHDAGFNSLPTFQRAFKASEQMTPKEFMASLGSNEHKKV